VPELLSVQTDYPRPPVLSRELGVVTFFYATAMKEGLEERERGTTE
jgi:hypothetical protein